MHDFRDEFSAASGYQVEPKVRIIESSEEGEEVGVWVGGVLFGDVFLVEDIVKKSRYVRDEG